MTETPDQRAARLRAEALDAPTISEAAFQTRSRRSFLVAGVSALVGAVGWNYLALGPQDDGIPSVLRQGHRLNERLWQSLHSPGALAPTFARSASAMPRTNGRDGLRGPIAPDAWTLRVLGPDGALLDVLDLDDLKRLPKVEMTTELKCIEGWSQVVTWGGPRFSDLAARYASRLPPNLPYVGLATPDGQYTVGMDRAAAMHPQTLLATEMQGQPLRPENGAPVRLATPLKYGVKSLKRVGTVRFMAERPRDFWAERGYDWHVGH